MRYANITSIPSSYIGAFFSSLGTTHMDGHTDYGRRYFAVKEKKNSKAGVGG